MIIAPVKQFLVDYKINNPSDTATYYVRAVIKNSITGATLATLNLTDNGNKYYSYAWMTPNDASGTGLQISIQKTVYTDSGYTTESPLYGTTLENYIIRELVTPRTGFAGSGMGAAAGVDYKKIEKMIRDIVAEIKFPEVKIPETKFPEQYDMPKMEAGLRKELKDGFQELRNNLVDGNKTNKQLKILIEQSTDKLLKGFDEAEKSDDKLHALVEDALNAVKYEAEDTKSYVRDGLANLPKGDEFLRDGARKLFGLDVAPASPDRKPMLEKLFT